MEDGKATLTEQFFDFLSEYDTSTELVAAFFSFKSSAYFCKFANGIEFSDKDKEDNLMFYDIFCDCFPNFVDSMNYKWSHAGGPFLFRFAKAFKSGKEPDTEIIVAQMPNGQSLSVE